MQRDKSNRPCSGFPKEFVPLNGSGYANVLVFDRSPVHAYDLATALYPDRLSLGDLRGQSQNKLQRGADVDRGFELQVNTAGTNVSGFDGGFRCDRVLRAE